MTTRAAGRFVRSRRPGRRQATIRFDPTRSFTNATGTGSLLAEFALRPEPMIHIVSVGAAFALVNLIRPRGDFIAAETLVSS